MLIAQLLKVERLQDLVLSFQAGYSLFVALLRRELLSAAMLLALEHGAMAQSLEERLLRSFEALLAGLGLFRRRRYRGRRKFSGIGRRLALSFRHGGCLLKLLLLSER
jgi:hypothetical protein